MCPIFIFPVSTSSSTEQDRSPLSEKCKSILRISRCSCTTPHHHLDCTDVSRQQCGLIFKRWNVLEELSETIFSSDAASWRRGTGSSATRKGKPEHSHNCYFFISICLCEFLSLVFFFVSVYHTQPFTLSFFLLSSLLSSTQKLFPSLGTSITERVSTFQLNTCYNWTCNLQLKLNHVYRSVVH